MQKQKNVQKIEQISEQKIQPKTENKTNVVSLVFASIFCAAALAVLIPSIVIQIKNESISMKVATMPEISVNKKFADPSGILNAINLGRFDSAKKEFQEISGKLPENIKKYFDEYFNFVLTSKGFSYIYFSFFEKDNQKVAVELSNVLLKSGEFLIKNYVLLEKYFSQNKKTASEIYYLAGIIPYDILKHLYDSQNAALKLTSKPQFCSNFKNLAKIYEASIVAALHGEKLTIEDARVFCMKENFCYMRTNQRDYGTTNTRKSERKEIVFDIIQLKQTYPQFLTEEGIYKDTSRYLEEMQKECERRNAMFWTELFNLVDFTAIP